MYSAIKYTTPLGNTRVILSRTFVSTVKYLRKHGCSKVMQYPVEYRKYKQVKTLMAHIRAVLIK